MLHDTLTLLTGAALTNLLCSQHLPIREVGYTHEHADLGFFVERKVRRALADEAPDLFAVGQVGVAIAGVDDFADRCDGFDLVGDIDHFVTGMARRAGGSLLAGALRFQSILADWNKVRVVMRSTARCSTVSEGFGASSGSDWPAERLI